MFRMRAAAAAILVLGPAACSKEAADPGPASGVRGSPAELTRACWVWHRRAPLSDAEADHLRAAGINRIYWHSADIVLVSNIWQFPQENPDFAPPVPDGFERVPVLRLAPTPDTAATRGSFPALGKFVADYLRRDPSAALQIDYACPDGLLPLYAELLGYVRASAKPGHLSVTALAGWATKPGFDLIQGQADEIVVLFEGLRSDLPADLAAGKAIPRVDLQAIRATLPHWRAHCRKPWLAGLPNSSQLSVFDGTGHLSGHAREWNRDALVFHPGLEISHQAPDEGTIWLVPKNPATLTEGLTVDSGQRVVLRQPVGRALRECARLASEAGASGVVWSPMPEPGGGTGFTASHLTALLREDPTDGLPRLHVTHSAASGILTLANEGPFDLPVRVAGDGGSSGRGWQLEIDAGADAAFIEARPGAFVRVIGFTAPDSPEPVVAPVADATRLAYAFAALPAATVLESGSLRLRSGSAIRWRLDRGEWRDVVAVP